MDILLVIIVGYAKCLQSGHGYMKLSVIVHYYMTNQMQLVFVLGIILYKVVQHVNLFQVDIAQLYHVMVFIALIYMTVQYQMTFIIFVNQVVF
jgi:hypothetical protein